MNFHLRNVTKKSLLNQINKINLLCLRRSIARKNWLVGPNPESQARMEQRSWQSQRFRRQQRRGFPNQMCKSRRRDAHKCKCDRFWGKPLNHEAAKCIRHGTAQKLRCSLTLLMEPGRSCLGSGGFRLRWNPIRPQRPLFSAKVGFDLLELAELIG